jgi:hypothetical protein
MATTILQAGPAAAADPVETLNNILRKSWLLAAVFAYTLAAPLSALAGSSYLAVWSSDKETDDRAGILNTDFLAIIDANPKSRNYGKVVNTASLESVPGGANLLNDLTLKDLGISPGDVTLTDGLGITAKYGLTADGIPSDALNEAHHMTHDPIVVGGHSYLYMGGLISANIFRCDVTDPLRIPICLLVTRAKDVTNFSGIDDFLQAPNGHVLVTYMGAKNLTTPGGLVEIDPEGGVVGEYAAAKPGGPKRYLPSVNPIPSINGETDTGLLAHPHGIDIRPDLDLLVTSDYADPLSLATSPTLQGENEDCGTTVRFWKLSDLKAGPTAIAQLPVGKGREAYFRYNAPEGVMSVVLTHLHGHKGVFASSMGGGTMWFASDATATEPEFRMIYRVGPGASLPVFFVTPDDRFLVLPIQGVLSEDDPPPAGLKRSVYNRDYEGEHSRRVIVLDIQKLLSAGTLVKCDAPPVDTNPKGDPEGTIRRILARNNGADDCPMVTGTLNLDSRQNFATHSGPHFVAFDHETRRVAASNYFVQLTPFELPGLHEDGDHRVCMARLTHTGELILDTAFKDELTGRPCVAMDRPASYQWPNRGRTGAAKPHAMAFINLDEDGDQDED